MPSQKNQSLLADLSDKLSRTKSLIIADYSGIPVSDQIKLRARVSEAGGQFTVTKNRLVKLALKEKLDGLPRDLEEILRGQNAFLFSFEDAVSALKALFEFSQENENLEIKLGLLDDKVLSYDEIKHLSKLPSKKELIGQLIARIQGPTFGLANVLSAPTRNLVYALKARKDQLETKNN